MNLSVGADNMMRDQKEYTGVHAQKLALWIAMAAMTMFFAALTSAFVVKKGDWRTWENFRLPGIFMFSTASVIATSVFMQLSLNSYRKSAFSAFRTWIVLGFLAAASFVLLQYLGWRHLNEIGFGIRSNASSSFLILIIGSHALHVIIGLLVLFVFVVYALRSFNDPIFELRNIINPKKQLRLELLVQFWHYIDLVWVYLFIFFYLNYQ